ncbi:MAG TPA: hypothetical protein VGZ29_05355 [Terriglobia bacterium]|nr:hypothetical protein [Terriglobia bacterium]
MNRKRSLLAGSAVLLMALFCGPVQSIAQPQAATKTKGTTYSPAKGGMVMGRMTKEQRKAAAARNAARRAAAAQKALNAQASTGEVK